MAEENNVQPVTVPEAEFDDEINHNKYANFKKFISGIRNYQKLNFDNLIFCSGSKGMGKSSCTIQLARYYNKVYFNEKHFDFTKYVIYDNKELQSKVMQLEQFKPIVADESVRFAMAQDWAQTENKSLMELVAQVRPKNLTFMFCIPRMTWLSKKYQQMCTFWIKIYERGFAVVFRPDLSESDDLFHLKKLLELEKHFFLGDDIDSLMNRVRTHPCYFDEFTFPAMPQKLEEEYMKARNSYVFDQERHTQEEQLKNDFKGRKGVSHWIMYNLRKQGMSEVDIAKLTYNPMTKLPMASPATVCEMLKVTESAIATSLTLTKQDGSKYKRIGVDLS